ncbi:MAG: branched-chain amino acid ABC transporter substrate-binding protein [Frankia sp.]
MSPAIRRGAAALALLIVAGTVVALLAARHGNQSRAGDPAPSRVATIGVIAPLSGEGSDAGQGVRKAVQLAVEQANESGALGPGWKLKLETTDDGSRPDGGAQAAQQLATNQTLIGVVGPLSSTVARVAVPTLSAGGIAVISPSNGDSTLTGAPTGMTGAAATGSAAAGSAAAGSAAAGSARTRPYRTYFRLSGTDVDEAVGSADYAVRTARRRRIAIVESSDGYGSTLPDSFATEAERLGATITGRFPLPAGASGSMRADLIKTLRAGRPDLVYVTTGADVAADVRTALRETEPRLAVMGADSLLSRDYAKSAGTAADGDLVADLGAPSSKLPSAAPFVAAYEQRWSGGAATATPSAVPDGDSGVPTASGAPADPPTSGSSAESDPASASASASSSASPRSTPSPDVTPEPPVAAAYAYDAARVLISSAAGALVGHPAVDAAARAGVVDRVGRVSLPGATGRIAFDRFGDAVSADVTMYRIRNGIFVPVAVTSFR